MLAPVPSRRPWWFYVRAAVALVIALAGGSYAVFGSQLLARVAALSARASRGAGEAAEDLQTRTDGAGLARMKKSFEALTAHREALDREVKALTANRAAVATRLDEEAALLRRVQEARAASPATAGRDGVDRDALAILSRVQAYEADLAAFDTELRRLTEALERLDRDVDRAGLAIRLRTDEFERRRASSAGVRAYRDGTDLANQIVEAGR